MSDETRAAIKDAVDALPVRTNNSRDNDIRARVRIALLMTVASADYAALN
jgi:hypothetical protein